MQTTSRYVRPLGRREAQGRLGSYATLTGWATRLCLFRGGGQAVLSTDLIVTPPLHECGVFREVPRQDQNEFIGDSVSVCDCEADASARKIEDSGTAEAGNPLPESRHHRCTRDGVRGDFRYS